MHHVDCGDAWHHWHMLICMTLRVELQLQPDCDKTEPFLASSQYLHGPMFVYISRIFTILWCTVNKLNMI